MSVILLMHEGNDLTGLDRYETKIHRQAGLGKF